MVKYTVFAPAQLRSLVGGMVDEAAAYHNNLVGFIKSRSTFLMLEANVMLTVNVIGRAVFNTPFRGHDTQEFVASFWEAMGCVSAGVTNP